MPDDPAPATQARERCRFCGGNKWREVCPESDRGIFSCEMEPVPSSEDEAMEAAYDAEIARCAGEYPRERCEGLRLVRVGWNTAVAAHLSLDREASHVRRLLAEAREAIEPKKAKDRQWCAEVDVVLATPLDRGPGICPYCLRCGAAGELCQCEGAKAARLDRGEPTDDA